jgi:hypothetical protein
MSDAPWSSVVMPKASQSIKTSFVIALVIGLIISGIFIVLDPYTGFYFLNWQLLGNAVAFVFWGMLGGSTTAGLAISWLVNGLMYSVPALGVIRGIVALRRAATK